MFCDVDESKIQKGCYIYEESKVSCKCYLVEESASVANFTAIIAHKCVSELKSLCSFPPSASFLT